MPALLALIAQLTNHISIIGFITFSNQTHSRQYVLRTITNVVAFTNVRDLLCMWTALPKISTGCGRGLHSLTWPTVRPRSQGQLALDSFTSKFICHSQSITTVSYISSVTRCNGAFLGYINHDYRALISFFNTINDNTDHLMHLIPLTVSTVSTQSCVKEGCKSKAILYSYFSNFVILSRSCNLALEKSIK